MSGNIDLNRPCSDSHLEIIANELTDWEMIALRLNLLDSEISVVERDCKETPQKKLRMLQKWKSKFKLKATYQQLIDALRHEKRNDLAERVCEISCMPGYDHPIDIYKPHISSFIEHLKAFYGPDRYNKVWPIMKQGKYCSLTLVEVKGLLNRKVRHPIEPKNIFNTNAIKNIIYIQGAPGSGKTTFLLQMGWMWAKGEWYQEFCLVIYINLKTSQTSKSLVDIFQSCGMDEDTVKDIEAVQGEGVLLLLDGWDELPESLQNESVFTDIVQSTCRYRLQKCTLVVAARYISENIEPCIKSHLEVKGFTEVEQIECINEIIVNNQASNESEEKSIDNSSQQNATNLLDEIKARPPLYSCCNLPLNLIIIVHVFIVSGKLPSTMSETLELLLLHSMHYYAFQENG